MNLLLRWMFIFWLVPSAVSAQSPNAPSQQQQEQAAGGPGSNLRIYLMTLGPGDAVWERFGHNGIVVEDARTGYSAVYDWGRFSFDQPGYVPRLMKGRMMYWMEGADAQATMNYYMRVNRSVYMQELNLAPIQRVAMVALLEWNALEQNKFYRYDYYRDNCSTRVRDAIDRILGGQLRNSLTAIKTEETYRSHTERLNYFDIPTYTGLQLAMGNPIDHPLSAWEEAFLPMELRKWASQAKIRDAAGREMPLVTRDIVMFEAQRPALPAHAPNLIVWYLLAGLVIGGIVLLLARFRHAAAARYALLIVVTLWCLAIGFFGLLISLLWAFTDHAVTYYNENIMQANPFVLALAVFAPAAILARAWALKTAARLSLLIAGLSVLGFILQIVPRLDQVNGEIIALMMPVHIAIAYALNSPRKTVTA